MTTKSNFWQQVQKNQLSIISLVIAILALSYNSWRNELSEQNRNYRTAGFEILKESAQLQLIMDLSTYSDKSQEIEPIQGWVKVNLILSLSEVMPQEIKTLAVELKAIWSEHWAEINESSEANKKISVANQKLVMAVRELIAELN